jgi:hypothetical protein
MDEAKPRPSEKSEGPMVGFFLSWIPERIPGEPAPFHPFFLIKKFLDAPETGEAGDPQEGGKINLRNNTGRRGETQPCYQKKGPNPLPK